jgi:hypothetical protein
MSTFDGAPSPTLCVAMIPFVTPIAPYEFIGAADFYDENTLQLLSLFYLV